MHITVHGLQASYNETGDGRVIVLLHGWGTNKDNLHVLADYLQIRYRVISLDLPGFGESERPNNDWFVADYAQFVQDFLESLGIKDVYAFVGHSFGGRIIIKGITSGVFSAQKLVFIGSAGVGHSKTVRSMAFATAAKVGKTVMKLPGLRGRYAAARQKLHATAGSTDYTNAGDMQQIFLNTIHEDLRRDIQNITLPTLLMWGSEDTEAPLADARFFHANIPGSTLKIIQGAGHFVHIEKPKKVATFIQVFLA